MCCETNVMSVRVRVSRTHSKHQTQTQQRRASLVDPHHHKTVSDLSVCFCLESIVGVCVVTRCGCVVQL
eukprot:m.372868 g.372868  ORF g.372868 m.372868 type:complete len:69 (-) comp19995_c19_seq4:2152-2358(-)